MRGGGRFYAGTKAARAAKRVLLQYKFNDVAFSLCKVTQGVIKKLQTYPTKPPVLPKLVRFCSRVSLAHPLGRGIPDSPIRNFHRCTSERSRGGVASLTARGTQTHPCRRQEVNHLPNDVTTFKQKTLEGALGEVRHEPNQTCTDA